MGSQPSMDCNRNTEPKIWKGADLGDAMAKMGSRNSVRYIEINFQELERVNRVCNVMCNTARM